jgi:hypothetical protein
MNHRYTTGELVTVGNHFDKQSYMSRAGAGSAGAGPYIPGSITATHGLLKSGDTFLVLKDAEHATWRYNKKLYTEILTAAGPRMVWASHFKKKRT